MNKIINYTLLLFFIFLLNCSYKPILKKDKYQFSINLNKVTGDNEINRIIVRNIKNLPKSQKVYDLTLSSNKEKKNNFKRYSWWSFDFSNFNKCGI